jgi:hypothetical protein
MERVTRKVVRIERSFRLGDANNPAGDYEVTTMKSHWAISCMTRSDEFRPRSICRRLVGGVVSDNLLRSILDSSKIW